MNLKSFICTASLATVLSVGFTACNGNDNASTDNSSSSEITNFRFNENIKSANRIYSITSPDYNCFLTITTSVQWPEKIADYDISHLRDTIIALTYPNAKTTDIDKAIIGFVDDYATYELGSETKRIDSIPSGADDTRIFNSDVRLTLAEITPLTATYSVDSSSYLGGAHPNSGSQPFTYLLKEAEVMDIDWLFTPGYQDTLIPMLQDAVAQSAGISKAEMFESMLSNSFPISDNVYILNGTIIFHYNPYILLPHSYGQIDASISPYMVRDILTPQAKALLLD